MFFFVISVIFVRERLLRKYHNWEVEVFLIGIRRDPLFRLAK